MQKRKNKKQTTPYLTGLLMKLAPKVGAKILVEPEWRYAAQLVYKNGITRSLRFYSLDLNNVASGDIAKDKDFAKFFMKKLSYPIAEGKTIFEDEWAATLKSKRTISYAKTYARKLGFPVVVKPNSKSQGIGVAVIHNNTELTSSLKAIFKSDKVAIVERYLPGCDYRIVVLDDEVISAYERIALSVIGNGRLSILGLLKQKQKIFKARGRDTQINFADPRMKMKLRRQGYSSSSILKKGQQIFLLDNANLSTGGDACDVTETISPGFKKIAVELTKKMGLRMAGVDIMVTEGDITKDPKFCQYYIIEINAAPGIDHYVTTGAKQRKIIEAMYLKILKALGTKE